MAESQVLLIRINSVAEVYATWRTVDLVRQSFPGAELVALATPEAEMLFQLQADARLDQVLIFPPPGGTQRKTLWQFRRFIKQYRFKAVVSCVGGGGELNHLRPLLLLLCCPGPKYLAHKEQLVAFWSRQGRLIAQQEIKSGLARLTKSWARLLRPFRHRLLSAQPDAAAIPMRRIRRILWIRLDHIGDVVMSLPALRALRARCPDAQIDALVAVGSAPILADLPDLNRVITYNAREFMRRSDQATSRRKTLRLIRFLRQQRYDLVVETRGNDTSRLLSFATGAPWRVGATGGHAELDNALDFLLTHRIAVEAKIPSRIEQNLNLVRTIVGSMPTEPFALEVAPERRAAVDARLKQSGTTRPFAIIHAAAIGAAKTWYAERFAAVADHLITQHDLDVFLTGTQVDAAFNQRIMESVQYKTRVYDKSGQFALSELPALLARARLMVTLDTGPMHIAAAVGTPLVALFIPWYAAAYHPYRQADAVVTLDSSIVSPLDLPLDSSTADCALAGITVAQVIAAVDKKLSSHGAA